MTHRKEHDLETFTSCEPTLRNFVEEHLIDECGLVRSYTNAETLKAWTNEELQPYNLMPICHANVNDPASYWNYENSLMGTGEYALSQVLRYEVTGDGTALVAAANPIYGILRVFYEGELFEKGFLPKPFGGVRQCAYSHELSPDQQIKSVVALRAYQKYAPLSVSRVIDEYLVALADYHFARGFVHPRRESFVVTPENRPHHICILLPILVIASNITGDAKYTDALPRFDKIVDDYAAGKSQLHPNLCSLMVECFHLAYQEGHEDPRYPICILRQREVHQEILLDDGHCKWSDGQMRSSESTRIASAAPVVDHYFPETQASKKALSIISQVKDPRKMLYITDTAGQPVDYHGPLHRSLCEMAIASWLVTYWRILKEHGTLEAD